jgi:type I restriction-modification system DNA methylase subunit
MVITKEESKEKIQLLINKYQDLVKKDRIKFYKEATTITEFIEPLFEALGWDVRNIYAYNEVSREEKISKGRADFGFRINGISKFFLEVKALNKQDLLSEQNKKQAIEYAWHKGTIWAVLTDFREIAVYNAETNDTNNRLFLIKCEDFLEKDIDQLVLLTKESFERGEIDKLAEKWDKKKRKMPIDKQLLSDFTEFRRLLSASINKLNTIDPDTLDESVQRILDRLIFIRVCEDREIEEKILIHKVREWENHWNISKKSLHEILAEIFRYFDERYNSELFRFHECEKLKIDPTDLLKIINGLYKSAEGSYVYDFSAIEADALGNVYEQYLGHILKQTEKRASIKEAKIHRKEQGIYYTPTYIVDYIVKNTVREYTKDKNLDKILNIKIIDPACGSGSFLIRAFSEMCDIVEERMKNGEKTKTELRGFRSYKGKLTLNEKSYILKNCIFGVDLDRQAVEIARLNLMLKLLEGESTQTLSNVGEIKKLLPMIDNIKCGNSLIDDQKIAGDKAFNWETEFKDIMGTGGFDIVIGNPPYGALFNEKERNYFKNRYFSVSRVIDSYILFIEKSNKIVAKNGLVGFIVPESWLTNPSNSNLRGYLLKNISILQILDIPGMVFPQATVDTIIIVIKNQVPNKNKIKILFVKPKQGIIIQEINENLQTSYLELKDYNMNTRFNYKTINLIKKIENGSIKLKNICKNTRGIETGDNDKYISKSKISNEYLPIITGDDIEKYSPPKTTYYVKYGKWLSNCKNLDIFKGDKIILQRIKNQNLKRRLIATIDKENRLILDSVHMIYSIEKEYDPYYILAVLNSFLMNFYFKLFSLYPRINADDLDNLPFKKITKNKQLHLIKLIEKLLVLNRRLNEIGDKKTDERIKIEEDIKKLDKEIDNIIYKLYDITEEEKEIIENE